VTNEATNGATNEVADEDARVRADFPFLDRCTYLNTAAAGVSWSGQGAAAAAFYDEAKGSGMAGMPVWQARAARVREQLARLTNVGAQEIRFVGTTTEGINLVAHGIRYRAGDEVVTAADEFPSVLLAWESAARGGGGEGPVVRRVPVPSETEREAALLAALTPATRVLAVSHVHWVTGTRVDLARLGAACRAHGTLLVVDGVQALGAVPVDLAGVDVYCAAVFKWLLSGFGLAVLVVRDGAREQLSPAFRGYNNPPPAAELQASHVNYPGIYALGATLDHVDATIGWSRVYARVASLVASLAGGLEARGLAVAAPPGAGAGIVSVPVPDPVRVRDALLGRGVHVEGRNGLLRVSPHFYNTAEDLSAFFDALARVA
jgi:cysteine desulfurase / selenocysteine lyase